MFNVKFLEKHVTNNQWWSVPGAHTCPFAHWSLWPTPPHFLALSKVSYAFKPLGARGGTPGGCFLQMALSVHILPSWDRWSKTASLTLRTVTSCIVFYV